MCPDEPLWPGPTSAGGGNSFPSWIDICNPPSGSGIPTTAQGGDPTASIQAALNYFNANNLSGRIYWSKPLGTIAAAATSGSGTIGGQAYSYNGQILVPARAFSAGGISITIMGLCPVPNMFYGGVGYPQSSAGSELISSLTTAGASVFDAIPGDAPISVPMTAIRLIFEDCVVRAPSNPQCNGVDGNNLVGLEFRGQCRVDTTAAGTTWVSLTGTGFGVRFPPLRNGGMARVTGTLEIQGYPTGFTSTEHLTADLVMTSLCLVGWAPGQGGVAHSQYIKRFISQGCQDIIKPLGTTQIKVEQLDYGDVSPYQILRVFNDPNNWLYGEVTPYPYQGQTAIGFPSIGGINLRINPFVGKGSDWPSDDFTRYAGLSTAVGGVTANTHHAWNTIHGSFSVAGSVLKNTNAGDFSEQEITYRAGGKASPSRTVRFIVTTGTAGYFPFLSLSKVIAGANLVNHMSVGLTGGLVQLIHNVSGTGTVVAQSAAAAVAAATQYTVDTVISHPNTGAYTVQVFLNGTNILTVLGTGTGTLSAGVYTLGTAEVSALADTDLLRTKDSLGIAGTTDTTSAFSFYRVSTT